MMRRRSWILIAFGVAICGYLLIRQIQIYGTDDPASHDVCSAVFGRGCDATLESPLSIQLGLPLAGWGLVYYGTLIALLVMSHAIGEAFEREAMLGATVLALVGAVASVVLAAAMILGLAPFCPFCVAVQFLNLSLVPVLLREGRRSPRQFLSDLKTSLFRRAPAGGSDSTEARWRRLGFFSAALVGMVLYQWVFIEFERFAGSAQSDFDPQRLLSEYRTSPLQEIPVDADDPVIGPSAAPARLVVFSDFQCIACRRFAQQMGTLQDRFGDRIQIVFKHFPLSSKCNNLERDLHPDACEWAWAADAARRQGKFWPVHDAFFASEEKDLRSILNALAAQSGLDLVRFDKDVSADATRAKIRLDVDLGNRLGVDGTPSVFLNGHRIRTTRMRSIAFLIEHEL